MSISDIKHTLRKYDFPSCAREALIKIEQLLTERSTPSNKHLDATMDVISEFVFCEGDRRGRRGSTLNALQELQLSEIICDYLVSCKNETIKNTIFLCLFGGMESQKRLKILSILASIAVSASSAPALLAVGVWLQQMGCSSSQSLQLVENIIRDHFYLNTSNKIALRSLAKTAPQFLANFITTVTELYMRDIQGKINLPPINLLESVTSWVYSIPTLCMSAQLNPPSLPAGSIPMAAVTPLAGLIHWCALAPLYIDEDAEMEECPVPLKKIKIEDQKQCSITNTVVDKVYSEGELYIKLHLGVLHSLRVGKRTQGPPTAVNAQHLAALVPIVQGYAHQTINRGGKLTNDVRLQTCLDRLGQAVQLALSNGCVYGNINSLLSVLDTLPENRLLRIVIRSSRDLGLAQ